MSQSFGGRNYHETRERQSLCCFIENVSAENDSKPRVDWNSNFPHKIPPGMRECVHRFARRQRQTAQRKMIWNGKSSFHHLPWINFNQFGWEHSNAKANIEMLSKRRWFGRVKRADNMVHADASGGRTKISSEPLEQIIRCGISDLHVVVASNSPRTLSQVNGMKTFCLSIADSNDKHNGIDSEKVLISKLQSHSSRNCSGNAILCNEHHNGYSGWLWPTKLINSMFRTLQLKTAKPRAVYTVKNKY